MADDRKRCTHCNDFTRGEDPCKACQGCDRNLNGTQAPAMKVPQDLIDTMRRVNIGGRVMAERRRQLDKWGVQHHPVILPTAAGNPLQAARHIYHIPTEQAAKLACQEADADGEVTWFDILLEEMCEVLGAAADPDKTPADVCEELVQVAAVCIAIVEDIEREEDQ